MFVCKSVSLPLSVSDSVVYLSKLQYNLDNLLKVRIKQFLQRGRILKDCSLADLFGLKHNIKAICKSHYQDLHIAVSVFYSQIKLPIKLLFLISLFVDVGKLCNIAISYIKAMFYFAEIVSRRMLIYGNKEYKIKS